MSNRVFNGLVNTELKVENLGLIDPDEPVSKKRIDPNLIRKKYGMSLKTLRLPVSPEKLIDKNLKNFRFNTVPLLPKKDEADGIRFSTNEDYTPFSKMEKERTKMISIKTSDGNSLEISEDTKLFTLGPKAELIRSKPYLGMCIPVMDAESYEFNYVTSLEDEDGNEYTEFLTMSILLGMFYNFGRLLPYKNIDQCPTIDFLTKEGMEYAKVALSLGSRTMKEAISKFGCVKDTKIYITNELLAKMMRSMDMHHKLPYWLVNDSDNKAYFLSGYFLFQTKGIVDAYASRLRGKVKCLTNSVFLEKLYNLSYLLNSIGISADIREDRVLGYNLVTTDRRENASELYYAPNMTCLGHSMLTAGVDFVLDEETLYAFRNCEITNDPACNTVAIRRDVMNKVYDALKKKYPNSNQVKLVDDFHRYFLYFNWFNWVKITAIKPMSKLQEGYSFGTERSMNHIIAHNGFII